MGYNIFMCGRYTLISKQETIEKRFHATFDEPVRPRYNAAPSQKLSVILNTEPGHIKSITWGLQPAWLKHLSGRRELINVKSETLREKKTFAGDLKNRRCIVIADGFYEWKAVPGHTRKVPYRILLRTGELFAFAGIWETSSEDKLPRFAIITTEPNALVKKIHTRMPVILPPEAGEKWLRAESPESALPLLKSYSATRMKSYVVSTLVNTPSVDVPDLIRPAKE